jgi:hypothetical protein
MLPLLMVFICLVAVLHHEVLVTGVVCNVLIQCC